ncbi:MAG TPA: GNAT family N-acetyltransferase [Polyangiaceae bacterium]|nr:GNAT family N-acetyltransferase [Polyangiaceae bacterium]
MSTPEPGWEAETGLSVEYYREPAITWELDRELRALLAACFRSAGSQMFSCRRYCYELPLHRWVLRDAKRRLVAHLALHDKQILAGGAQLRVGGIAEVCVLPSQRGRGHVKRLLSLAHALCANERIEHTLLFGDLEVYASSGYAPLPARAVLLNADTLMSQAAPSWLLWRACSGSSWPLGEVDLSGPEF